MGENLETLGLGDSFGDAFVERRIWATWPILDDGLLKVLVCKLHMYMIWTKLYDIDYKAFQP